MALEQSTPGAIGAGVMGDSLNLLRVDLARRSQWNIGYFASGFLFWVYVAAIGSVFPLLAARVYWLVGTFFIFPVAVAISRLLRADPFSKGNALGEVVGYTTIIWFALPERRAFALPLTVALAYLVTVVLIPPLLRRWLKEHAAVQDSTDVVDA